MSVRRCCLGKHNGDEFRAGMEKKGIRAESVRKPTYSVFLKIFPFLTAATALFLIGPLTLASPLIHPAGAFFMELEVSDVSGRPAILLMLSGRGSELWGGWEDVSAKRVGLVEGIIEPDGRINMTFRGNFRKKVEIEGWFSLFGSDSTRIVAGFAGGMQNVPFHINGIEGDDDGDDKNSGNARWDGRIIFRRANAAGRHSLNPYGMANLKRRAGAGSGYRHFSERRSILAAAGSLFSTVSERVTWLSQSRQVMTSRFEIVSETDGTRLGPGDFFIPGRENQILPLLSAVARRDAGISEGGKLTDAGFFSDDIPPGDGVFICQSGMGFGYDRYRLAPYAAGDFRFVIPWGELEGILRPDVLEKYGLMDLVRHSDAPGRFRPGIAGKGAAP